MSLTRIVECPACEGDPEWEVVTGYDPRDGSPTGWIERCSFCHGTGEVEIEAQPIEQGDLP
jgi:hypothetical protein